MEHERIIASVLPVLAMLVVLSFFCGIHFADLSGSMTCTSVVFDKQQMLVVDRIDFYNFQTKTQFSVTDKKTIKRIIEETMVATNTDIQCPKDIEIKLYCNEELVRTMYCGTDYTFVNVYNGDALHWYLLKGTESDEGYVHLSKGLQQLLLSLE